MEDDTDLIVPVEHRRVLSYGAGYLLREDKDDSGMGRAFGMFQAQYKALLDEYRRNLRNASPQWGVVVPRVVSAQALDRLIREDWY